MKDVWFTTHSYTNVKRIVSPFLHSFFTEHEDTLNIGSKMTLSDIAFKSGELKRVRKEYNEKKEIIPRY